MPSMMTSPGRLEDRWSGNATGFMRMLYAIQVAVLSVRSWPNFASYRSASAGSKLSLPLPPSRHGVTLGSGCGGSHSQAHPLHHEARVFTQWLQSPYGAKAAHHIQAHRGRFCRGDAQTNATCAHAFGPINGFFKEGSSCSHSTRGWIDPHLEHVRNHRLVGRQLAPHETANILTIARKKDAVLP